MRVPGQSRMRADAAGDDDPLVRALKASQARGADGHGGGGSARPKRNHTPPATRTDLLAGTPAMWVADVVVTLMVIVALFWVYSSWFTNIAANKHQATATREISGVWNRQGAQGGEVNPAEGDPWMAQMIDTAAEGTPLMKMYIPRLGDDWQYTAVKGVTQKSLVTGPGLYSSTQLPGQVGNMAFAGHRDGNGAPFFSAETLRTCDAIVVETRDHWYTYRVLPGDLDSGEITDPSLRETAARECLPDITASQVAGAALNGTEQTKAYAQVAGVHITTPDDNGVLAPIPGNKGAAAGAEAGIGVPLMTLTTCHPLYFNYQRLIVHAALEKIDPVRDGFVPAALEGNAAVATQE